MMTQSYYGDGCDAFGRPNQRTSSTAAYYERQDPYSHSYYDAHPQDLRSEYAGRNGSRTLIQEQGSDHGPTGLQRRRIQVACSRCRRRKIKCTGDPGDGSGCSACRSAGADRSTCTFNRVGSHNLSSQVIDLLPTTGRPRSITPTHAAYSADTSSSSYDHGIYQAHHRPSLPMLQTRSAYGDYDPYGTSPPDDYSYSGSSTPRQPSYSTSSSYGAESFRPWSAGTMSAPIAATNVYYEPGTSFGGSFGTLQAAPTYTPTPSNRLPSVVTTEALSPLNMASMHTSLPQQTVQERRLPDPVPFTVSNAPAPSYDLSELPQLRPLGCFTEPRAHIHGIHSRSGMPWSQSGSRTASLSSLSMPPPPPLGSASTASSTTSSAASSYTSDPILGYQFSSTSTGGSAGISPTAGPAGLSESYPGTSSNSTSSMLPPSRRGISRGASHPNLPSLATGGRSDDYHHHQQQQQQRGDSFSSSSPSSASSREATAAAAASLYSFSTGIDTTASSSDDRTSSSTATRHHTSSRHHHHHYHHQQQKSDADQSQQQGSAGYSTYRPLHATNSGPLNARY